MKGINRMRRQDFLNNFGGYYLMLEKKLMTTFNYVELSTSNFSTFSNEYALLIQSIGAELDSFFKLYCSFDFNEMIIPGISEPPVRTLRATIPENERHIFR